ncbi:hypothetical protein D9M71_312320 [compost metagenome]
MLATGVLQEVAVRTISVRIVPAHAIRVGATVGAQAGVLQRLVDLQGEVRRREHHARQVDGVGVGHDQLGERVALQLGVHRQASGALQIVEAVAVLQFLQLVLEHEVEGRAEHAAERCFRLGQAADPQVDGIHASDGHAIGAVGPGARAVEEGQAVSRRIVATQHQSKCGGALIHQGSCVKDGLVRAIGGDEVDQRLRMLQVQYQVGPAEIWLELGIAGLAVDLPAHGVQ